MGDRCWQIVLANLFSISANINGNINANKRLSVDLASPLEEPLCGAGGLVREVQLSGGSFAGGGAFRWLSI